MLRQILDLISKCLPTRDLLTLRLVDRRGRDFGTTFLIGRRAITIQFRGGVDNVFLTGKWRTLDMLTEFLTSNGPASSFPCVSFSIVGGPLESEDLQRFFTLHGGSIKKLKFSFTKCADGGSSLRKLLTTQVPNLEDLEMGTDLLLPIQVTPDHKIMDASIFQDMKELPKLKTLGWGSIPEQSKELMTLFLRKCVNLTRFDSEFTIRCNILDSTSSSPPRKPTHGVKSAWTMFSSSFLNLKRLLKLSLNSGNFVV